MPRAPPAAACSTAPISAERNGSTRLPSLEVPSANSTTEIAAGQPRDDLVDRAGGLLPAAAVDEDRALQLGGDADQRPACATSLLATKATGVIEPIATMSAQDT